ncbi:putative transforming protein [Canis familiaris papillomavirus 3]|uniref:Protein E6 n=1 Tax=Canis familiaris papillomavirus 3 TaxID=360397 RepID=Q0QLX6_9PAPI|nr:putative transforming protein [Canis familiaris papillomavirus 3]ABC02203.1 putative transforming protein [Canis familiaris papillomavirus 3]
MERPWSLASLCVRSGVSLCAISIPCVFCGNLLSFEDRVSFDFKVLQVSWKNGLPHACCTSCARSICSREVSQYTSEEISYRQFVQRVGQGFYWIPVRCTCCLGLVTTTQKIQALYRRQKFKKVRGRWRTLCTYCAESDNDWERRYFERHRS